MRYSEAVSQDPKLLQSNQRNNYQVEPTTSRAVLLCCPTHGQSAQFLPGTFWNPRAFLYFLLSLSFAAPSGNVSTNRATLQPPGLPVCQGPVPLNEGSAQVKPISLLSLGWLSGFESCSKLASHLLTALPAPAFPTVDFFTSLLHHKDGHAKTCPQPPRPFLSLHFPSHVSL